MHVQFVRHTLVFFRQGHLPAILQSYILLQLGIVGFGVLVLQLEVDKDLWVGSLQLVVMLGLGMALRLGSRR